MKLTDIMEKKKQKWNVGINKTLAYRVKSLVVDIVDGSFREQYTKIHDYGHELLRENPGSSVKITSQPIQGGEESSDHPERSLNPHFQRIYICFKACIFFQVQPYHKIEWMFFKGLLWWINTCSHWEGSK